MKKQGHDQIENLHTQCGRNSPRNLEEKIQFQKYRWVEKSMSVMAVTETRRSCNMEVDVKVENQADCKYGKYPGNCEGWDPKRINKAGVRWQSKLQQRRCPRYPNTR